MILLKTRSVCLITNAGPLAFFYTKTNFSSNTTSLQSCCSWTLSDSSDDEAEAREQDAPSLACEIGSPTSLPIPQSLFASPSAVLYDRVVTGSPCEPPNGAALMGTSSPRSYSVALLGKTLQPTASIPPPTAVVDLARQPEGGFHLDLHLTPAGVGCKVVKGPLCTRSVASGGSARQFVNFDKKMYVMPAYAKGCQQLLQVGTSGLVAALYSIHSWLLQCASARTDLRCCVHEPPTPPPLPTPLHLLLSGTSACKRRLWAE